MTNDAIDTTNKFLVAATGDGQIVFFNAPRTTVAYSRADALVLAAWLVAMAGDDGTLFQKVLTAVNNT